MPQQAGDELAGGKANTREGASSWHTQEHEEFPRHQVSVFQTLHGREH